MRLQNEQNIELILDICLNRLLNGQETIDAILNDYPNLVNDLRPRMEAALWLVAQKANTQPRPEFISASSRRLMARLEQERKAQIRSRQAKPAFWQNIFISRRFALQFAVIVILVFSTLLFTSNLALAAQGALPGETLYPLKTSLESAQLALTYSPIQDAQLHINYAERRLVEMQTLTALGKFDDIETTLNNLDQHVTQAVEVLQVESEKNPAKTRELAVAVQNSLTKQENALNFLKTVVPDKNQAAFQHTLEISARGVGVAQKAIEASGGPSLLPTATWTETALAILTEIFTPSQTSTAPINPLAQPTVTLTPPPALVATDTEQAVVTLSAQNTPKPTNTHRPTQKPTKEPKPTKTPKPPKPTKTPK